MEIIPSMQSLVILAIAIAAYGSGAVLARLAMGTGTRSAVHPLEAIQVMALMPMLLLLRRPEYSAWFFATIACAVCVMGATMACAALLTEGRLSKQEAMAKRESNRVAEFFREVVDYEVRLAHAAWGLMGQMAALRA